MDLVKTVSKILGKKVTEEEAKDFANNQFGVLTTWLREKNNKIKFPNGFTEWIETYHEIVTMIELEDEDGSLRLAIGGRGGQYKLAKNLTDKFEVKYLGNEWVNVGYFDAIEEFCNEEFKEVLLNSD